jgi:hypothetical protein
VKIQTDFGRLVETVLLEELDGAAIAAADVDVIESQTNTYALIRLRLDQKQHELRIHREEGTNETSIRQRVRAWIKNTLGGSKH